MYLSIQDITAVCRRVFPSQLLEVCAKTFICTRGTTSQSQVANRTPFTIVFCVSRLQTSLIKVCGHRRKLFQANKGQTETSNTTFLYLISIWRLQLETWQTYHKEQKPSTVLSHSPGLPDRRLFDAKFVDIAEW
jgi:hypothetical protein